MLVVVVEAVMVVAHLTHRVVLAVLVVVVLVAVMELLLELQILVVAVVVAVQAMLYSLLVLQVVLVSVLFPILVPSVAPAVLLHRQVAIQFIHLHHLVHTRLNHAKHYKCTSRQLYNHHSTY